MADAPPPAAASPPAAPSGDRPARRPLLWLGALLWGGVFVALLAAFLLRGDRSEPVVGDDAGQLQTADGVSLVPANPGEAGGRLLPGGVEPSPEPVYDPEGLPAFSLTERRGEAVTNETLEGTPWVAGFVFTRCASKCPLVTDVMSKLRRPLKGTGVKLVTLTVDPEYDTSEILTTYADFYDAADDPDWLFLTGSQDEIYDLIGKGFKQPVSRNPDEADPGWAVFHTFNLMLVGPDGVVRGKYNSQNPAEMVELRRDAKRLLERPGTDGAEADNGGEA